MKSNRARQKMKQLRLDNGFTQAYVAEKSGISRPAYTLIELGLKNPSLQVSLKIKETLNYHNDDIFLVTNVTKSNIRKPE